MKNTKEIKNANFHKQINGEKIKEMTMILLLSFNNKTVYDIVCCENNKQINDRIKEIKTNNILGVSYIAVTDKMSFIEYKRIQIINNK